MFKELEILIRKEMEKLTDTHYEPKRTEDINNAMEVIKQALTPPTADEVCEHLNESFGLKGRDTMLHFIYDKQSREFRMVSKSKVYRYISTKRQSDDSIELIDLDIDDIIILGLFFKGEIK